jgi:hypothetical protein
VLANAVIAQLIWLQPLVKIHGPQVFRVSVFMLLAAAHGLLAFEFSEHSVSPSGQFIIYGADSPSRGAVSALAEQTKTNLLAVLKRRDAWKIPIVVNLRPRAVNLPEVPSTELRFSRTETGVKLQLDLAVSSKISPAAIQRELTRVTLVEMVYCNQTGIQPGDVYIDAPAWLVDGLLASAPNRQRGSLAAALSAPARVASLSEFLNLRPENLDSSSRELYRACSFVLVRMLIDSPNGRSRLGRYIDNLAFASNDPISDLRAAFPEVRDFESSWKSKVTELKSGTDNDLLTFPQTDERLNELLETKFPSRDGREISLLVESFSRTKPTSVQQPALQEFSRRLLLLAARANPVLRPIIQDYQQMADQLALGRSRGIEKRLGELHSLHTRLSARMSEVNDYLNWFEAAKMETPSGIFDDYLQAAGAVDSRKPKRRDALSVYLDAMEMEF